MDFALESLGLPTPKVHRVFTASIPDIYGTKHIEANFIVMDYIPGPTVEECWGSADQALRESMARQIADMINKMQSRRLNTFPPGLLGRGRNEKFKGPWFTDYGAGPFTALRDLEVWCNHKIDVCILVQQLPADFPRFQFQDLVFTHQGIAPRNLILDAKRRLWLVDWGCAGVCPRGFEQAVLQQQSGNDEFANMLLAGLLDQQEVVTRQYAAIGYGLSTGRHL
jgi:hypothetical protein